MGREKWGKIRSFRKITIQNNERLVFRGWLTPDKLSNYQRDYARIFACCLLKFINIVSIVGWSGNSDSQ